ncbi:helix-turn-helix domain-containing protein, partial [Brevundimonas mediterranea]|uniref:helix-turn-helix domain-containing protein n=1 Tax=Brevundimonas mediterranea TaxID=74329 RepID=UPI0040336F3F
MIMIQLDRLLLERRMSLTELSDRVGVTLANLSILKTGKARAVRFSICGRPLQRKSDFREFLTRSRMLPS